MGCKGIEFTHRGVKSPLSGMTMMKTGQREREMNKYSHQTRTLSSPTTEVRLKAEKGHAISRQKRKVRSREEREKRNERR